MNLHVPLPLDPSTTVDAVAAAIEGAGGVLGASAGEAVLRGNCRLVSPRPVAEAMGIAAAWTWMTQHRRDDPRAGARIVADDAATVRQLRDLGYDATTPFHQGRDPKGVEGVGILIVVDMGEVGPEELARIMDVPSATRIAIVARTVDSVDDEPRDA